MDLDNRSGQNWEQVINNKMVLTPGKAPENMTGDPDSLRDRDQFDDKIFLHFV
jgi:hypothetical protein